MARRKWTSIIGKKRISDARGVSGADGREREKKAVWLFERAERKKERWWK